MALQQRISRSRVAFSGTKVGHAAVIRPVGTNRSRGVSVRAMVREWPDKEFIAETLSIFPDEGVANAEQARVSNWVLLGSPGPAIGHDTACTPGFVSHCTL
jgi:hypothetical protein